MNRKNGSTGWRKTLWLIPLLVQCSLLSLAVKAAPPEHWLESGYAYNAKGTSVVTMLQDFSDSFGVRLELSPGIQGQSDGWLRAANAVDYLDRLAVKFKLQWFVYNKVLYVSPISDNLIKRIEISQDGAADLKRALKGVGLLEEKFGWGEITEEGAILISGPEKYVNLVKSLVKMKEKETKVREEVMVFPLQHAAVDDRDIYIRQEHIVIPGVASVLRNLLEKKRSADNSSTTSESLETLRVMADSAEDRLEKSPWQKQTDSGPGHLSGRGEGVRVEADVRTNSVLIYDSTAKKSYYRTLIDTLDVPQNLIEIEAVIVDIDRNKLKELGVDWQHLKNGRKVGMNVSGIGQNPVSQFNNGSATMLIADIEHFYASLRLLESQGEASVIANPSVLTLENQPAVIDLSETAYIETIGERVANVMPVTAGTMLRVTPRQIRGESGSKIQLVVDIEDGRIVQNSADELPRVRRNTIATKAVIDQDYSLVVGGYHIQESRKDTSKVPWVGDLPVVGSVFTSTTNNVSQRERLFILTPHVSDTRHDAAAYAESQNANVVEQAVGEAKERHLRSSNDIMDRVRSLFVHLAQEELPNGYTLAKEPRKMACRQEGVQFNFSGGRTVRGPGLEVSIGTVENRSKDMVEVSEASCDGSGVIAVAIWPHSTLGVGQKAEVFVARHPVGGMTTQLPSLVR